MFVRVCFRQVGDDGDRLRFDLSVDSEKQPLATMSYFGFWGSLQRGEIASGVMLSPDGTIDVGHGGDANERYHRSNLLQRKIDLGQYATVWWNFGGEESESTYIVEAVTDLAAISSQSAPAFNTAYLVDSVAKLPRFRARVIKSFDIEGYDNAIYRPPIGVEGDLAIFQDEYVFCPDEAVSKSGEMITAGYSGRT